MIAVIDYNAGNNQSVANALNRLEVDFTLTSDASIIKNASHVILPGVGHAASAMAQLKERGLDELIPQLTQPLLGICLGMQLLFNQTEEGNTECLGIIEGKVTALPSQSMIVPHMGWNNVDQKSNKTLFDNIADNTCFYLVHSYYVGANPHSIAMCEYGLPITVAVQKDNYFGVQFHPEKSSQQGLQLLRNFTNIKQ